jgi:hypothetical protein
MKHVASPSEQLEPVRLIAGGGTARERRLLEAAADDVMPLGTPERLEQALSAWAALPAGQGSEPARAALGGRLSRWGLVGGLCGLGGVAVVIGMLGRGPDGVAPELSAPTGPVAVAPVAVTPAEVAPAAVAQPTPPALASLGGVAPVLEAKPSSRTRGAARHQLRPGQPHRGNLLEEARRLDAVRSALGVHDGPAARRELAEYRARFPRGELALEADVLEADVLLFAGDPERARALANAVLARPDAARYRQRLEQLLQRAGGPGGSKRASANMAERR